MTENPRVGIEHFLEVGRRKVEADEQASERRAEDVRTRLVTTARVVVDKYQRGLQEAVPHIGQSYSGVIRPFWEKLVSLGIRDQLVSAGCVGYGAGLIADPILYEWPSMAQRALAEGGISPPDRDDLEDERLTRAASVKPCQFDAEDILDPVSIMESPRVINDFAGQIRGGRSDEYVGALLVKTNRRLGK